jgi:hypothetical protein
VKHCPYLFNRETTKESKLDYARLTRIKLLKPVECFIQGGQIERLIVYDDTVFVKRDLLLNAAPFAPGSCASVVNENTAH